MKVNTSKSKNAESFYIKQSYLDANGKSTSRTIRKLGTLNELLLEHGPTRDDVMNWAKEQARIETEKFEQEKGTIMDRMLVSILCGHNIKKTELYFWLFGALRKMKHTVVRQNKQQNVKNYEREK